MIKIRVSYRTGDSFHDEDTEEDIELQWNNLAMAEESLRRIQNHHKWTEKNEYVHEKPKSKLPDGVVWIDDEHRATLELLTDEGKPYKYTPFWEGYFERLYDAEIVSKKYTP